MIYLMLLELKRPQRNKLLEEFVIFRKCTPHKRPRFNGHTFQIKDKHLIQEFTSNYNAKTTQVIIKEPCIVDQYYFFQCKDKHPTKPMYGDEDNLRKTINDILVDIGCLHDDRLVVGGEQFKISDIEDWIHVKMWSVK